MASQPSPSDLHVNTPLTNMAIAYYQDEGNLVAGKVFPRLKVKKQSDKYFELNKNDLMRNESGIRAPNSESRGGGWNLSTSEYFCDVHAFHQDLSDQALANSDLGDLKQQATKYVMWKMLLEREADWASNFFTSSSWDYSSTGVASGSASSWPGTYTYFTYFSDYTNSDPIRRVHQAKDIILENNGFDPNTIVMGKETYTCLLDHVDFIDRIKYGGGITANNKAIMAELFDVENVYVMKSAYATNIEGETAAYSFVGGDDLLLVYVPAKPGLFIPSAGYIFEWTGFNHDYNVRISDGYDWKTRSTRVEGEAAYDAVVTGASLGFYFDGVVE